MAPEDSDRDVLSSLPRTRPQRRSAKRDRPVKAPAKAAAPNAAAPGKRAPRKAKAAKPAPARSKAGARRRMPPAGFAPPRDDREQGPPSGVELVGTAIQAAGELAQIGLALGGHALRSALGRAAKGE